MIVLVFCWGVIGLVVGFVSASQDVETLGWICLIVAIIAWSVVSSVHGLRKNASASIDLERNERKRTGGSV